MVVVVVVVHVTMVRQLRRGGATRGGPSAAQTSRCGRRRATGHRDGSGHFGAAETARGSEAKWSLESHSFFFLLSEREAGDRGHNSRIALCLARLNQISKQIAARPTGGGGEGRGQLASSGPQRAKWLPPPSFWLARSHNFERCGRVSAAGEVGKGWAGKLENDG